MPGLVTGTNLMIWSSQVRWPWGEKPGATAMPVSKESTTRDIVWRDAADVDETLVAEGAHWTPVAGLGSTGRAMALLPAADELTWKTEDPHAPTLTYRFNASSTGGSAIVEFLPTFRLYPGKKLRVAVVVDDQPPQVVEVPGSSGAEDEVGRIRQAAVQDNFVRATIPLPALTAGPHTLKIRAIDPGAIVNRIALPTKPATRATS
jgi:hypothetical protein